MPIYAIDGLVPVIHSTAFVHPTAVLIGDVIVGPGCYVGPGASLRGDFGRLILEAGCNVQDNCIMHSFPDTDTVIEENGHIGHGAVLHACRIGRNALVGMNAVVNDGAVVGESAIVAALAFVKAGFEVPARHLAAGIPAKVLRELTEAETAWKVGATEIYQRLTERCRATLVECTPLSAPERNRRRLAVGDIKPLHEVKGR
jgi:phenylacetic acid degradation protein